MINYKHNLEKITIGGGCFWCIEAIFSETKGVHSAISGYSGGDIKNPSYNKVITGQTNYVEVVQLSFDPKVISCEEVLTIFWQVHDPTTINRQGSDIGTQYRSVVFYHNDKQKEIAEEVKKLAQKHYKNPIVTEITAIKNFYEAENYHKNYYNENPNNPYCILVINPKLYKFRQNFKLNRSTQH
jgi:peptide-methionine (S)-S-oxide reductase